MKKYIATLVIVLLSMVTLAGCTEKNNSNVQRVVAEKLDIIVNKKLASSNPYDYIEASKEEYNFIIQQGDLALKFMLAEFEKSTRNGLKEYIMSVACSEILGGKPEVTGELYGINWYEYYVGKYQK